MFFPTPTLFFCDQNSNDDPKKGKHNFLTISQRFIKPTLILCLNLDLKWQKANLNVPRFAISKCVSRDSLVYKGLIKLCVYLAKLPTLPKFFVLVSGFALPTHHYYWNLKSFSFGDEAQVAECLPGKHEALGSVSSTTKNKFVLDTLIFVNTKRAKGPYLGKREKNDSDPRKDEFLWLRRLWPLASFTREGGPWQLWNAMLSFLEAVQIRWEDDRIIGRGRESYS